MEICQLEFLRSAASQGKRHEQTAEETWAGLSSTLRHIYLEEAWRQRHLLALLPPREVDQPGLGRR